MKTILAKASAFLCICISMGCSSAVETQEDRSENLYSIYGVLDVSKPENVIRIHDNRVPVWESPSEELDIDVILQDMSNLEEEVLTDLVIPFDRLYTHNFPILTPIKYDNIYQLKLDDKNGFKDSILVKTPRLVSVSVFIPEVRCDEIVMEFIFDPIDYDAGELLDFNLEFEYLENIYGITEVHYQLGNPDNEQFVTDSGRVKLTFPLELSLNIGLGYNYIWSPEEYKTCQELRVNELILYYAHYSKELDPSGFNIDKGNTVFGKRILGVYSDSIHIVINDSLFQDELRPR